MDSHAPEQRSHHTVITILGGLLMISLVLNAVFLGMLSNKTATPDGPLEACLRKAVGTNPTADLVIGRKGGLCIDYYRSPALAAQPSHCLTPGTVRVEHGLDITYTNVGMRYVQPGSLCIVDTNTDRAIACAPREVTGNYANWTIGSHMCKHRWWVDGTTGICLRPSLREPGYWTEEARLVLEHTPGAVTPETDTECTPRGLVVSTQLFASTTRFNSLHTGTGLIRHAVIAGKNFYVIGNPTRQDIQDGIDQHEARKPRTDTVVLPMAVEVTNEREINQFNCKNARYLIPLEL